MPFYSSHTILYCPRDGAVLTRCQFRPSGHVHKRAFVKGREGTEPPAKRTRASLNGKSFEFLQLSFHDDGQGDGQGDVDEYHTPMEPRRATPTLDSSNQGSEDSYRVRPDPRQAEGEQALSQEPRAVADGFARLAGSRKSGPIGQQTTSVRERFVLDQNHQTDQRGLPQGHSQEMQSRLAALEATVAASKQHAQQEPWAATMRALDSRIVKLEREKGGLDVSSLEDGIKRLISMLEKERRERRVLVSKLEAKNNSLTHDVAVLQGENEGLRERLNKLTGKVRSVAEGRAYRSREEKEQSC